MLDAQRLFLICFFMTYWECCLQARKTQFSGLAHNPSLPHKSDRKLRSERPSAGSLVRHFFLLKGPHWHHLVELTTHHKSNRSTKAARYKAHWGCAIYSVTMNLFSAQDSEAEIQSVNIERTLRSVVDNIIVALEPPLRRPFHVNTVSGDEIMSDHIQEIMDFSVRKKVFFTWTAYLNAGTWSWPGSARW